MGNQASAGDQFLRVVRQIIEDNMGSEDFSVSELAREVGLSRSMLHRKLIRHTGKSATQLITEIRLSRAKELIENELATISEVAYMVGFTSPSYFNKVFKKNYQVSPGEIRKKGPDKQRNLKGVRDHQDQNGARLKKSGTYLIFATKILSVIIVLSAAVFAIYELVEGLAPFLGLSHRSWNLLVILLCAGTVFTIALYWIYHLQTAIAIVKNHPVRKAEEAERLLISGRWKIASYVATGVIMALIVLNLVQKSNEAKAMEVREKTIAVLPFQNDSPDPENEHITNGMMQSIQHSLSQIGDLEVISRVAVEPYRNAKIPIRKIAAALHVNYLLTGSVQKYGDQIRLILELIDRKGRQLWNDKYDRKIQEPRDYIDLESEIAQQVASQLNARITPKELQIIEHPPTNNILALGLYRKGREEHMKFWLNNNDLMALSNAMALYRSAQKEDPTFGHAYAGLALAIHESFWAKNKLNREFSVAEKNLYRDTLMHLAEKALSLDPNLEEAYLVTGNYYYLTREYERALQEYDRALQINPNYSRAWDARSDVEFLNNWIRGLTSKLRAIELERGDMQVQLLSELGDIYEIMGFPEKAEDVYLQTLRTTGDSATYCLNMAGPQFCRQNQNKRIFWMKKSLELDPDQIWPFVALSDAYRQLGNLDSAAYYAFLLRDMDHATLEASGLEFLISQALLDRGRIEEAHRCLDHLESYMMSLLDSDVGDRDGFLFGLARIYCLKGQPALAMDYLKQIDRHSLKPLWFIISLETDDGFETIRSDPEFQSILSTLKSSWQDEHDRVQHWMEANGML